MNKNIEMVITLTMKLIDKERTHLRYLIDNCAPNELIEYSNSKLSHYKSRLSEYIDYFWDNTTHS